MSAHLGNVERYAAAAAWFAHAVGRVDARAPVPTCPGWTTFDLVAHLGNVHAWAATIVETQRAAEVLEDRPPAAKGKAMSLWYAGKAEDLYQVLRGADPESECWNFAFGAGRSDFWSRRQLHETVMHSIDLARAGAPMPELDPEVCADGIDEALRVFGRRMHDRGHPAALAAPVTLVARDVERSWTLTPAEDGPPLVEDDGGADDRVVADANTLLLVVWKRLGVDEPGVELGGDEARVRAFLGSRLTA